MIDFVLPDELAATRPAAERDGVRLMVVDEQLRDARFRDLPVFLRSGDLLVVNTSATLPAAVDALRWDGRPVVVHFAAELGERTWVAEVRPAGRATGPVPDAVTGERLHLPHGVVLALFGPVTQRLWRVEVEVEGGVVAYLDRVGRPVSYPYVDGQWPLAEYQTVFAGPPGSAEMPSAGRPFTAELVTRLVSRGVLITPVLLHTGLSSPEAGEPPQAERFQVPVHTARIVNTTRRSGGRVVAVGTTVVRALETAAAPDGSVAARHGWTDLVLGADRPARAVDGLITGWHAPRASHLELLEAVAGAGRVSAAYQHAVAERYLWHEFGDSALLWRQRRP